MFCKFQNNEILIEMYQEKMDVEIWSRMQRIHIPLRMVHIHGAKITKNQTPPWHDVQIFDRRSGCKKSSKTCRGV